MWEPPKAWWETLAAIMTIYIARIFPVKKIWERHQLPQATTTPEPEYVTVSKISYKVEGSHRARKLKQINKIYRKSCHVI